MPIHGYPIVSSFDFPSQYKFPSLPLGKSLTRSFNMRSTAPVEFEYLIDVIQKHPAFHIEPLEGIIPFNRDAYIHVTFTPKEFCTAIMTIQIIVSQFNSKPIVCTFYGTSTPGLSRDRTAKNEMAATGQELANVRVTRQLITDADLIDENYQMRARRRVATTSERRDGGGDGDVAPKSEPFVDYEGYRFPKDLNNPWAVSKVLLQKKGKLSLKEIKSSSKKSIKISAQLKETLFLQSVNELEDEERRNQLKWQVKLGESPIDSFTKEDILRSRAQAEYDYRVNRSNNLGLDQVGSTLNRIKLIWILFESGWIKSDPHRIRSNRFGSYLNRIRSCWIRSHLMSLSY